MGAPSIPGCCPQRGASVCVTVWAAGLLSEPLTLSICRLALQENVQVREDQHPEVKARSDSACLSAKGTFGPTSQNGDKMLADDSLPVECRTPEDMGHVQWDDGAEEPGMRSWEDPGPDPGVADVDKNSGELPLLVSS